MAEPHIKATFSKEEWNSQFYKWSEPKKIKFFVYSTHEYYRNSDFKKRFKEDSDGKKFDIDVYRMREEFILPNIHEPTDLDYMCTGNLQRADFWGHIENMKKNDDLYNYDCFFFMFFTFLKKEKTKTSDNKDIQDEMLHFDDGLISIHDIWEEIKAVQQFAGKPKIFFIQSDDYDVIYPPEHEKAPIPITYEVKKIPIDADRLVIQSTIPGRCANSSDVSNPSPSFLIQAFLDVMGENRRTPSDQKIDMLSLTTDINRKVKEKIKLHCENFADILPFPMVTSTLTRFLIL